MEKQPLRVQLLTQKGESFQVKLPHLDIPVTVDREIYQRMCKDPNYQFSNAALAS